MPSTVIDSLRSHNKNLAFTKINDAIAKAYLGLALVALGGVIVAIVQRITHKQVPFLSSGAVDSIAAPVLLAHVLIYINSDNFYETYYVIWDRRQADRVLSTILWLFHPFVLIMSLIYMPYWVLWIALLILAVFVKNAITRAHEAPKSPARTLLTVWLRRSAVHLGAAVVMGCFVWTINADWLYLTLKVDMLRPDVSLLIRLQRMIVNWLTVILVALGALTRLQPREDFPLAEIRVYEKEMEAFLQSEISGEENRANQGSAGGNEQN